MGVRIEMISTTPAPGIRTLRGTLFLSAKAGKKCLQDSKTDPAEIELLIFAGMYRDQHIGEPSIASLLQKELKINSNLYPLDKRTFSFDVNTGGCGLVNSIEILNGFISSGKVKAGMILTGDSEPFRGLSKGYNFRPAASAMVLRECAGDEGFKFIKSYSYPEYASSFRSFISWERLPGKIRRKNIMVIEQSPEYLKECLKCTNISLQEFLKETRDNINDIDLIIPSHSPAGFPGGLNKILDSNKVLMLENTPRGEIHTSGIAFGLQKVWDTDIYRKARKILFVSVGAGISNSFALYHKESG